jgi:hypothetical protein
VTKIGDQSQNSIPQTLLPMPLFFQCLVMIMHSSVHKRAAKLNTHHHSVEAKLALDLEKFEANKCDIKSMEDSSILQAMKADLGRFERLFREAKADKHNRVGNVVTEHPVEPKPLPAVEPVALNQGAGFEICGSDTAIALKNATLWPSGAELWIWG